MFFQLLSPVWNCCLVHNSSLGFRVYSAETPSFPFSAPSDSDRFRLSSGLSRLSQKTGDSVLRQACKSRAKFKACKPSRFCTKDNCDFAEQDLMWSKPREASPRCSPIAQCKKLSLIHCSMQGIQVSVSLQIHCGISRPVRKHLAPGQKNPCRSCIDN